MRTRATSKPATAIEQAIRWLERREYFLEELRAKLCAKGYLEDEVDSALSTLEAKRVLSDARALDANVRHLTGKRTLGREQVKAQLAAKGASHEQIESVLADDDAERSRARELLAAKFPDGVEVPKAARFLASRGFEPEIIEAVLDALEGQ